MRLLVTEFITGGGLANHPLPETLKQEGLLMLETLLADCSAIPGIELQITLDDRVKLNHDNYFTHLINDEQDYMDIVMKLAQECDYTWVIAPESNGVLTHIIKMLEDIKCKLINCDTQSSQLCSDKLACNQLLSEAGINVIPVMSAEQLSDYQGPVIVKKRAGAGSEELQIFGNGSDASVFAEDEQEWIVQPYIEGKHKSLSAIFSNSEFIILSCNEQVLSDGNQPSLRACIVNQYDVGEKHQGVVEKIAKSLPGLKGYVGIDYVDSNNEIYVVDINPRLSTSYVGLNRALKHNPARLCIDAVMHQLLPENIERNTDAVEVTLG